jgi:hypothetical protein
MNHAVEMVSCSMINIPSFMKIGAEFKQYSGSASEI